MTRRDAALRFMETIDGMSEPEVLYILQMVTTFAGLHRTGLLKRLALAKGLGKAKEPKP